MDFNNIHNEKVDIVKPSIVLNFKKEQCVFQFLSMLSHTAGAELLAAGSDICWKQLAIIMGVRAYLYIT